MTSTAVTIGWTIYFDFQTFGFLWPRRRVDRGWEEFERLKPYVRWWALCAAISIISVFVYAFHCDS